ncbi:MAG: helix-turn-helix domain-containing protein [Lentisphaerae bacterium]|nr:helix-turn-helix domain-containing protein [Lentisphaerota bacterium]
MNCQCEPEALCRVLGDEMDAEERQSMETHLGQCTDCTRMLAALRVTDRCLEQLDQIEPDAATLLDVRRAMACERQRSHDDSLMTMDEVAEYLRLDPDEFERVASQVPAFEFAGKVLVRRSQLLEWVRQRERTYANAEAGSLVTGILAFPGKAGVA